jgi:pSer/pThr/pTyr-binding forkhead associated (FHA) protein
MTDSNRKTLRSFLCRDYLWELFEMMTRDLGCSMDYLINESMRHYARSRNYSLPPHMSTGENRQPHMPANPGYGAPQQQQQPAPGYPGQYGNGARGMEHHTFQRMPAVPPRGAQPPPPAYGAPSQMPPAPGQTYPPSPQHQQRVAPPPPPPPRAAPPQPQYSQPAPPPPPQPPQQQHHQPAMAQPPAVGTPAAQGRLTLVFNNQRYPIDKDKFIIGRGSTMTDLTIRDGNISRKHAAIIFRNGAYYIKDLDSTNGIDYRGNRIDSKKVEEGDAFNICDYELRFTYR